MGIASYIINKVLPVQITKIQRTLAFSTTTTLGANAVYTSPTVDGVNQKSLTGMLLSDQGGSYFTQHSDDGINWTSSAATATSTAGNTPVSISSTVLLRYVRYVFTNGATAQTSFRFSSYLSPL